MDLDKNIIDERIARAAADYRRNPNRKPKYSFNDEVKAWCDGLGLGDGFWKCVAEMGPEWTAAAQRVFSELHNGFSELHNGDRLRGTGLSLEDMARADQWAIARGYTSIADFLEYATGIEDRIREAAFPVLNIDALNTVMAELWEKYGYAGTTLEEALMHRMALQPSEAVH